MFYKIPIKKITPFFNFPIQIDGIDISLTNYQEYKKNYNGNIEVYENAIDSEFNFEQKQLLQIDIDNFENFSNITNNKQNLSELLACIERGNHEVYIKSLTPINFEKYFHKFYEKVPMHFIIDFFPSDVNFNIQLMKKNSNKQIDLVFIVENQEMFLKDKDYYLVHKEFFLDLKNLEQLEKKIPIIFNNIPKEIMHELDANEISSYPNALNLYITKYMPLLNSEDDFPNKTKISQEFMNLFRTSNDIKKYFESFIEHYKKTNKNPNFFGFEDENNPYKNINLFRHFPKEEATVDRKLFWLGHLNLNSHYLSPLIISNLSNIFSQNKEYFSDKKNISSLGDIMSGIIAYHEDEHIEKIKEFLSCIKDLENLSEFLKTAKTDLSSIEILLSEEIKHKLYNHKEGLLLQIQYRGQEIIKNFHKQADNILNLYEEDPNAFIHFCIKSHNQHILTKMFSEKLITEKDCIERFSLESFKEISTIPSNENPIFSILKNIEKYEKNPQIIKFLEHKPIASNFFNQISNFTDKEIEKSIHSFLKINKNDDHLSEIIEMQPEIYRFLPANKKDIDLTIILLENIQSCDNMLETFKSIPPILFKNHDILLKAISEPQLKNMLNKNYPHIKIPFNDNQFILKILERIETNQLLPQSISSENKNLYDFISETPKEKLSINFKKIILEAGLKSFTEPQNESKIKNSLKI